jgi:CPA2 family monovalent cation:H+ antiporter-2
MTGSYQIRIGGRIATFIDHKLPKSVLTFVSFYESWLTRLRNVERPATLSRRLRGPLLMMLVDAALLVAVIIGAASSRSFILATMQRYRQSETVSLMILIGVACALGVVFALGLARHAIRLARVLSLEMIPAGKQGHDLGRAPRRALELALELAALLIVGLPVAARHERLRDGGALVVLAALVVVGVLASRSLSELDKHARAGAELIVDVLARQGSAEHAPRPSLADVSTVLPGLDAVPMALVSDSPAVGKSLAEIDLRAKTGASVLALTRDGHGTVNPSPREALRAGDVLALTGSDDALNAARDLLLGAASARP